MLLSSLIIEREELESYICPALERDYNEKLGRLEYSVAQTRCKLLRQRRRCEYLRAASEYRRRADLDRYIARAEHQLDIEFARMNERLAAQKKRMDIIDAYIAAQRVMSDTEYDRLRRAYRSAVIMLHPEIISDRSETVSQLCGAAQNSYRTGDSARLGLINSFVNSGYLKYKASPSDIPDYIGMSAVYDGRISREKELISKIRESFPIIKRSLLDDDIRVARRRRSLNDTLAGLDASIDSLIEDEKRMTSDVT